MPGLDPSWAQALVEATDAGRVFGRDIVFTYGPLHQAVTAELSNNLTPLLFSRIAFTSVWFFVAVFIGTRLGPLAEAAVALSLLISTQSETYVGGDIPFYLLALIGIAAPAAVRSGASRKHQSAHLALSVLLLTGTLTATLVKLSYTGAWIPVLLFSCGLCIFGDTEASPRKILRHLGLLFGLPILSLATAWSMSAEGSILNLPAYYFGANMDIVKGYADAMSYDFSKLSVLMAFSYLLSSVILLSSFDTLVLRSKTRGDRESGRGKRDFIDVLCLFCLSMLAWVVFKASFVRDDGTHTIVGSLWLVSFFLIIVSLSPQSWQKRLGASKEGLVAIGLTTSLTISCMLALLSGYRPPIANAWRYTQGFFDSFHLFSTKGRRQLATRRDSALAKIRPDLGDYRIPRNATVDILPFNITNVVASRLHYTPRPVPQSYTVYSQKLQELNREFFAHPEKSPEWLILDVRDIDGRLPIGLDSPSLAIISHAYLLSHKGSQGSLVFRKRSNPQLNTARSMIRACSNTRKDRLQWHQVGRTHWQSQAVQIPRQKHGLTLLKADFKDSLSRLALSFAYRPFPVFIEYLDAKGDAVKAYRFIQKAGRDMIVYPVITGNEDFLRALASSRAITDNSSNNVVALRFTTRNIGAPFSSSDYAFSVGCRHS